MKKIIIYISLIILIAIPLKNISAQTLNEMYNELKKLQTEASKVSNGKKLTEEEINKLKTEIGNIEANIEKTENQIKQTESEIKETEASIDTKKDETDQMLLYLQLKNANSNSMLEYIFQAKDYTDFIYRYSIVTRMSDYNTILVNELNELVNKLNTQKENLNNQQNELANQKQQQSTKLSTLNANLKQLTEEGTSIEDDIKSLKLDINKYEKMGCSKTEDTEKCVLRIAEEQRRKEEEKRRREEEARKNQTSNNNTPSTPTTSDGWYLPVSSAYVTSQFQVVRTDCYNCGGSSHRGIDLGVGEGTPVYAAASGTVAYVVNSGSSLYCGGIKVYIYHIVNGNLYTTVYMHLLSANVSYGQTVTPNTIIGYSGGRSTATRYGGYDACTTGAHLHFGVASGNSVSSFNSRAFNPRNLSILTNAWDGARVYR